LFIDKEIGYNPKFAFLKELFSSKEALYEEASRIYENSELNSDSRLLRSAVKDKNKK
jgi:hypothetical protein